MYRFILFYFVLYICIYVAPWSCEARHLVPLYVHTCSGMTIKLNLNLNLNLKKVKTSQKYISQKSRPLKTHQPIRRQQSQKCKMIDRSPNSDCNCECKPVSFSNHSFCFKKDRFIQMKPESSDIPTLLESLVKK